MVDWYGNWTEEKDYSVFPKEKWCMYDYLAVLIRNTKYQIKTDMENLINHIITFCENESEIQEKENYYFFESDCNNPTEMLTNVMFEYVMETGLEEYDFYA